MVSNLAVVGLGYVGLPLAQEAVRAGLSVVGFDLNPNVVHGLNESISHVDDLSNKDIAAMRRGGFFATTDPQVIQSGEAVVICVPTPLDDDGGPDLRAVTEAATIVGANLRGGTLVVLESTTYPGTTEEIVRPILERESALTLDVDYFLAFSPERIDPGNPTYGVKNTPKIVGGVTQKSTDIAAGFYRKFIDVVIPARGAREAETAKLLENTYRHVNIALVNEMVRFCHELDIDLWNVIRLADTKPFGFQAFYPGVGVGGHCIPIDPNYLSYDVRKRLGYPFRFVELAQEINATMPAYVATRAQTILNRDGIPLRNAHILLLGVTYKPNVSDLRESPSVALASALLKEGVDLEYHDPRVTEWTVGGVGIGRAESAELAAASADLTILLQNHHEYSVDKLSILAKRFFDTTGATTSDSVERL